MELQSEQINELATALCKAQAEITPALKDSANPFFKSKYADLESVWNACRGPLTKHGLCVLQSIVNIDGQMTLVSTLAHSSGQYMRSFAPILSAKMDAQGVGSAISYFRRYSLAALVGVVQSDDDGEAAQQRSTAANYVANAERVEKVAPSAPQATKVYTKITDKQLKFLTGLIGSDTEFTANILKQHSINSLAELPPSEFNDTLEKAKDRRNKKEAEKRNGNQMGFDEMPEYPEPEYVQP